MASAPSLKSFHLAINWPSVWGFLRAALARIPLPMLALAASYGVYSYAALFVPLWVAIIQAAAFEATYVGLAAAQNLDVAQRRRATMISIGAVVVSIIYNSLAGYFHRNPEHLTNLPFVLEVALAVLHGAPLAIVGFLVADLMLHSGVALVAQSLLDAAVAEMCKLKDEFAQFRAEAEINLRTVQEAAQESLDRLRTQSEDYAAMAAQLSTAQSDTDHWRSQTFSAQQEIETLRSQMATAQDGGTIGKWSVREVAQALGMPEATLRAKLTKKGVE